MVTVGYNLSYFAGELVVNAGNYDRNNTNNNKRMKEK